MYTNHWNELQKKEKELNKENERPFLDHDFLDFFMARLTAKRNADKFCEQLFKPIGPVGFSIDMSNKKGFVKFVDGFSESKWTTEKPKDVNSKERKLEEHGTLNDALTTKLESIRTFLNGINTTRWRSSALRSQLILMLDE